VKQIGFLILFILLGSAFNAAGKTILYQEDFSHYKSDSELLKVVESGHPEFSHALELRSVKQQDGKIRQGSWRLPLENADAIQRGGTLEILFWMKAATESARYALLADGNRHKAITVIQNDGFLQVSQGSGWNWKKIVPLKMGQWHKILYRVQCSCGAFDVFVDDMAKPIAQNMPFREPQALFIDRIWTLGSENSESKTLFGPITVSLTFPREFPPEVFNGTPYFLKGVGWTAQVPTPETFASCIPLALAASSGTVKEAARLQLLRDPTNLYCLFRLDARDMTKRAGEVRTRDGRIWTDDCFELFIRPDLRQDTYYHLAGNASGALYDSKYPQPGLRDAGWNCRWSSRISKDEHGWTALVIIPFSDLGCSSPENAVWGFAAGRENPHTREVLSWTIPERFGKLYFPAEHDPRPAKLRIADLMDACYEFPYRVKSLSEKLQGERPFTHPILSATQQQLGVKLKALMRSHAESASFQEFIRIDANLRQLTSDLEVLLRKSRQMAAFFTPGSEGQRRAYVACVESPMTQVMDSYCGNPATSASLLLSGNEYGSFQVVLLPQSGRDFQGVTISFFPLKDRFEKVLEGCRSRAFLVESVRTAMPQKEVASYPDVLKPGVEFKFKNRVLVPLWFDFYLPPETPIGRYQTQIRIQPEGGEACTIPVTIEATGLTLPQSASLDTAFCFSEAWTRAFYGQKTPPEKMREYCAFILEHRLEPMNLWGGSEVDIGSDALDYGAQHGKTMLFLPITHLDKNKDTYRELIQKYRGKLRPIFFGHDEVLLQNSPEKLADMKKDFGIAQALFPDVPRLNTASVDERLFGYVDIWCPLFDHFNAADSAERIKRGEKVWWYPTDYPLAPYANFNLDSPGIDARIIPWMNWKLNISGLLYWGLNREWLTNTPEEMKRITPEFIRQRSLDWLTPEMLRKIISGESRWPEVPWLPYFRSVMDAKSVSATNGGGNLFYPGPNWEPWPSVRLKNLRDGMQDYEYFVMLQKNADALKAKHSTHPLLSQAQKALAIDDGVLRGETRYTQDPEQLLAFRQELIRLVQETAKVLR